LVSNEGQLLIQRMENDPLLRAVKGLDKFPAELQRVERRQKLFQEYKSKMNTLIKDGNEAVEKGLTTQEKVNNTLNEVTKQYIHTKQLIDSEYVNIIGDHLSNIQSHYGAQVISGMEGLQEHQLPKFLKLSKQKCNYYIPHEGINVKNISLPTIICLLEIFHLIELIQSISNGIQLLSPTQKDNLNKKCNLEIIIPEDPDKVNRYVFEGLSNNDILCIGKQLGLIPEDAMTLPIKLNQEEEV